MTVVCHDLMLDQFFFCLCFGLRCSLVSLPTDGIKFLWKSGLHSCLEPTIVKIGKSLLLAAYSMAPCAMVCLNLVLAVVLLLAGNQSVLAGELCCPFISE